MKIYKTSEQLPEECVNTGEYEVWWFNTYEDAWYLGIPMMMDLDDPETGQKWTHWTYESSIPHPGDYE